jgi:hypothetical protein
MPLPQLGTATGAALAGVHTARFGIEGDSVLSARSAVKFQCGERHSGRTCGRPPERLRFRVLMATAGTNLKPFSVAILLFAIFALLGSS